MVYTTHDYAADFDTTKPFYLPEHELDFVVKIGIGYLCSIVILQSIFGGGKLNVYFLMFLYNILLSALSLYMFLGFLFPFIENWSNENYDIEILINDPEMKMAQGMQWVYLLFYWTKYFEYIDTIWTIILGKMKFNPRCILQVYHHFITPSIVYCGLYYPMSGNWTGPLTNTFVHVIMYAYWAGSYLFKQKWYKKIGTYIYYLQMTQFYSNIIFHMIVLAVGYRSHQIAFCFIISQYLIFTLLFISFFIFRKKEMQQREDKKE